MGCKLYTLYVKKYREFRRISQSELAFRIGKSQSFIAQIEKDNSIRTKSILLIDLVLIAQVLDVCPNDLIRYKCNSCHRFNKCTRHENLEKDDEYFKEHLNYYI